METQLAIPVTFTPGAIGEIRQLLAKSSRGPGSCLRIGVKGGGCAGLSYILDFDTPKEQDDRFEVEGIPVVMNRAQSIYLAGMVIDFQHGLNARGFTFSNPNAGTTCGCGSSFSV